VSRRQRFLCIGGGAVAAVCVQPLIFMARLAPAFVNPTQKMNGLGFMLVAVLLIAAVMVLLLGIPVFLLLRKMHRESWTSLAISGMLLGALPYALFWPSRLEGYSAGKNWHGQYVDTYVNGMPTIYARFDYAENILYFAAHGLVGALAFYATWRWLRHGLGIATVQISGNA
jgi:uncharacterized membrane protein